MSFPYIFEANFDTGDVSEWTSETDTGSRLDVVHYAELARLTDPIAPWRGAFVCRVDLATSTNDAFLQADAVDIAPGATGHLRFGIFLSDDLVMADGDEFEILQLQSAGPTDEFVIEINFTDANGLRIGVGETAATSFTPIDTGRWVLIELQAFFGAAVNGVGTLRVDGEVAATVSGLTNAASIHARMGVVGQDAGTTRGRVYFDHLVADDTRVGQLDRFTEEIDLTKSAHAFVGPGCLANVTLESGGAADNVLTIFDTDDGDTVTHAPILKLANTGASEIVDPAAMPKVIHRGCFVQLAGSDPRAKVSIDRAHAYGSDEAIRAYGLRR